MGDPEELTIYLQKCMPLEEVRIQRNHPRSPDVGTGVLVSVRPRHGEREYYYGEYRGHGQSKTAFELKSYEANQTGRFHGKVLKVSRQRDMEPSVFRFASDFGVTTSILHEGVGVDTASGNRFHCWITERTIPLDDLCKHEDIVKSGCSLAAFCCMLRAAELKLYMSDCHFFNFGLRVTEDRTKHVVVIIDAGSRGISDEPPWSKGKVNNKVMGRFWAHCTKESAMNHAIRTIWHDHNTLKPCLEEALEMWNSWPFLTKSSIYVGWVDRSSYAIWEAMNHRDACERTTAQASSAFRIVEIVGRWAAGEEWNNAAALVSYKAARTTEELSTEEANILDELYQRITHRGAEDVVAFWGRLRDYRNRSLQSSEGQPMTPERASQLVESFKYHELWRELTRAQQERGNAWRSIVNTILHKRAGWNHVSQTIMEYGLPIFEQPENPEDATEHITAIGQFVVNLAAWLKGFASRMHAYMRTERYQTERYKSMVALDNRRRRTEY